MFLTICTAQVAYSSCHVEKKSANSGSVHQGFLTKRIIPNYQKAQKWVPLEDLALLQMRCLLLASVEVIATIAESC